ncbi:hypothetical protein Dimus_027656 [Dionaea muscipula]
MELFLSLLSINLCIVFSTSSSSSLPPLCHDNERTVLLQFKLSFSLSEAASSSPLAEPKTKTWNSTGEGGRDCCQWDVPIELSKLSKLISLDLSLNINTTSGPSLLKFDEAGLVTLVRNLTSLKILDLSQVQISARVPTILANSTRLVYLFLKGCEFYGQFPEGILMLPSLQLLSYGSLVGSLPEFCNSNNHLQLLQLAGTGFSGQIPHSINNLDSLVNLDIHNCGFEGQIPNSLGGLTKLSYIRLSHNNFSGQIPSSFANLTGLAHFDLAHNQLNGDIPSYLGNFSDLNYLDLTYNAFTGAVEFDLLFSNLTQLQFLQLSYVDVIVEKAGSHIIDIFPHFSILVLLRCDLHELPGFLSIQRNLEVLFLDGNKISGPIPGWFCNVSRESLLLLRLSKNSLTGFPEGCSPLPWVNHLYWLLLDFNKITGSLLPPPSSSLLIYAVASNQRWGEISPLICKATSLISLDLSSSGLSGRIPRCLGNLGNTLMSLNLSGNNLHGTIPETFPKTCLLLYLYLNDNQLQGEVPRSLPNCPSLEVLDLTSNQINGTFPDWLGDLPQLQGLLLRSNRLNGQIEFQSPNLFPKLRILDLSGNSFTGPLPQKIFSLPTIVSAAAGQKNASYVATIVDTLIGSSLETEAVLEFTITITYKGKVTSYGKVLNIFAAIDLSNNRFVRTIPKSIGNLVGLQSLNVSYNSFIGAIPRSIASLLNIEVMYLSHNMLFGEIPQQLAGLTTLEMFNVSYNNLIGKIPQGNQFNTFENDSFAGNTGLCGFPLSALCGGSGAHHSVSTSPSEEEEGNEDSWTLVDLIIISLGFVAGLVVGMIFGRILTGKYHEWSVETFGRRRREKKRRASL